MIYVYFKIYIKYFRSLDFLWENEMGGSFLNLKKSITGEHRSYIYACVYTEAEKYYTTVYSNKNK